jgi:hypothetical protein
VHSATYGMAAWIAALQQTDAELTTEGIERGSPEWNTRFDQRWQEILRASKEESA